MISIVAGAGNSQRNSDINICVYDYPLKNESKKQEKNFIFTFKKLLPEIFSGNIIF